MALVDLEGAWDLHIHSRPSLFNRTGSDLEMARHAAEAGLAGIMVKNHFESTVGRAFLVNDLVPSVTVLGGLVLNHFTGGLNPVAVEHSLRLGAGQIWMPTLDALGHVEVYGGGSGTGWQQSHTRLTGSPISILDQNENLLEEAKIIVELVKEAGALLGTAHLSPKEIFALAGFSHDQDFKGLLITHPYFNPPRLSVAEQAKLAELGATLELCGGNLYPIPGLARLDDYVASVKQVGAKSLILTSDAGQPRKSLPAEVLRIFAQCLLEKGITQTEIDVMTKENPAQLLGL